MNVNMKQILLLMNIESYTMNPLIGHIVKDPATLLH